MEQFKNIIRGLVGSVSHALVNRIYNAVSGGSHKLTGMGRRRRVCRPENLVHIFLLLVLVYPDLEERFNVVNHGQIVLAWVHLKGFAIWL